MGAFNILIVDEKCNKCKNDVQIEIQFKFGDVWQNKYKLGDVLRWGGNDHGIKGAQRVVLDGVAECDSCKEEIDYLIYLDNDKFKSVEVNRGKYDFTSSGGYFIVIER